jgi:hypothetical protein
MQAVSDLAGLWTRSLLRRVDGTEDTTTSVRWLQGERAFIDLRQPATLSSFAHIKSLEDLTTEDCLALATQQGFAGHLAFDGAYFEWHRAIDYQPRSAAADAGALWWEGEILIEQGRDEPYIEHWHRDPAIPATPSLALSLSCPATGAPACFLRVGPFFMFARDRAVTPPPGTRLADGVAGAADIKAARALIDCEISFGHVETGYQIIASTLPHRVGTALDLGSFAP